MTVSGLLFIPYILNPLQDGFWKSDGLPDMLESSWHKALAEVCAIMRQCQAIPYFSSLSFRCVPKGLTYMSPMTCID